MISFSENSQIIKSFFNSPYYSIKMDSYFHVYESYLSKYRNLEITILEIGVLDGGSLFMWRDFFGSKARIIGIDVNPRAKLLEKFGFEIYVGNQSDKNFWRKFLAQVKNIDIVIDDGGHTYLGQITAFVELMPIINNGGVYLVEDTHTSYMSGFGYRKYSFIEYSKKIAEKLTYRCSLLQDKYNPNSIENSIYSVSFFDSIVIFNIDRTLVINSCRIDNNKPRNISKGFSHKDLALNDKLTKVKYKFKKNLVIFKLIVFIHQIYIICFKIKNYLILRKYFKSQNIS